MVTKYKIFFSLSRQFRFILRGLMFCLWLMAYGATSVFANSIALTNVSLVDQDTTNNTYDIQFDVAWDNSWYISGAPSATANWDAAWVFAKYSTYSGGSWSDWAHCTLLNTGSTAPTGSQMSFGDTSAAFTKAHLSIALQPAQAQWTGMTQKSDGHTALTASATQAR